MKRNIIFIAILILLGCLWWGESSKQSVGDIDRAELKLYKPQLVEIVYNGELIEVDLNAVIGVVCD